MNRYILLFVTFTMSASAVADSAIPSDIYKYITDLLSRDATYIEGDNISLSISLEPFFIDGIGCVMPEDTLIVERTNEGIREVGRSTRPFINMDVEPNTACPSPKTHNYFLFEVSVAHLDAVKALLNEFNGHSTAGSSYKFQFQVSTDMPSSPIEPSEVSYRKHGDGAWMMNLHVTDAKRARYLIEVDPDCTDKCAAIVWRYHNYE
ncbi:MAG: hypothetical protein EPO31_06705 [Gammaproteobacteria bacterium]|nr:MAG: hypothetical protein EPO31_06705 [Gammaproteobacteria bacterium]